MLSWAQRFPTRRPAAPRWCGPLALYRRPECLTHLIRRGVDRQNYRWQPAPTRLLGVMCQHHHWQAQMRKLVERPLVESGQIADREHGAGRPGSVACSREERIGRWTTVDQEFPAPPQ